MNRSMRRLVSAAVLIITFIVAGTIGGFFDPNDFINRVQIAEVENEFGGFTLTKVTMEDKVVSWTKSYDKEFMPTIDDQKGYMYQEVANEANEIESQMIAYVTERSVEDVVKFYEDYYADSETVDVGKFISVTAVREGYDMSVSVEKKEGKTFVNISAVYPNE